MAQQEGGWPLGLQPLHVRVNLMENHVLTEPRAFNTLIAVSPSFSSQSSSDLDTVSTGSFFYDKSVTLGNLIGLQQELGASNGRTNTRDLNQTRQNHKNQSSKSWCCLYTRADAQSIEPNSTPSLGQFLEVERRAAAHNKREKLYINFMYEDLTASNTIFETNPLFSEGRVVPPQSMNSQGNPPSVLQPDWLLSHDRLERNTFGSRVPTLLSSICGRTSIKA
ncbi:hypothetical protein AMTRI_Chr07g80980 [Amborella trichopoda]|uniref:Uncharacterized protein n=1 Tax=Amborella trichopoda TaxID=13333 RepID=W1NHT3_AMBTC|nr:uncharacterized protein At3g17950 [Amborella trichopoda]XP_020524433.1 uncharacterized protein At3g17950 [Amborella trichopoda]XP_020524444.1 uncharacterized protein At3g17950 [Amborella trichopoda]XP_020524450.1 uncharacterized protein At3g17950 [Amborella trichopoda]ERM95041.1 hypothetical protein AMTR_s00009p00243860 [Amborella trichopoda]|eukprot:XP_006827625.1 uncharacterized protein At3g17950 [Amborella trichopoda]